MASPTLITLLAILTILTSAKETCTTTISRAQNFRLVASLTNPQNDLDPPIAGHVLSSYHISACYDVAELVPPISSSTGSAAGRAFYVNGTGNDILTGNTDVLSDGGTPPTPYGIVVPEKEESAGGRMVRVQCGEGTKGLGVKSGGLNGGGVPTLQYKETFGVWYACETELPYGPAVVLYYRGRTELTPEACVEIQLDAEW